MEDRLTPALSFELLDGPAADHRAHLAEVAALDGVERSSLWENQRRDRDDLPRTLDEFDTLAVHELREGVVAPRAPAGSRTLHFARYPRPAQGRLTGRPTVGLLLVLISPRAPDDAQALRDWGDFVHLRHIAEAAVPGYTVITPYERAGDDGPRFLHLYEMDTDDPEAAFQAMTPLVAARLGGTETDAYREWAFTPSLRIDYVNTFRRAEGR